MIATSVTSLSSEPPSLIVCINRASSCHRPLRAAGAFCVNLLGEEHAALASQFSNTDRRHERFSTGDWQTLSTGAPVLAGAMAAFDCRVENVVDYTTHSIFIAAIQAIRVAAREMVPLVYFDGRFGGFNA